MSVMPDLYAPTLVGPYKQIPGGMMPMPGHPAPPSPADLARQRKNQAIDQKRRAGTQALQTMQAMPAQAPAVAAPAPKPAAAVAPKTVTPDAYLQSQQNLIGAENKLLGVMGQPQPQYKPPNKGLEYLAAGIALLFPGAPIASAAGGLLQGMQQGAQDRYARQTEAQQQEIGNAERQTQVFGTIADAQARIQAQLEATRERQAEYAQRHADTLSALQEKRSEFQQLIPIRSAAAQSLINYRYGELSNAAARNTITQQDAQLRAQTVLQIAAFREASMNGRHAADLGMRSAANQLGLLEKQTDNQIRALDASVSADPTQAPTAQASAAQLIANEQAQAQKIIGNVSSGKPDVLKIENFAVPPPALPAAQPQYSQGDPYQPPQTGYSLPPNPWGAPHAPTPVATSPEHHAAQSPFAGHPNLGIGKGVDAKTEQSYIAAVTQHAASFASEDALLHDLAQGRHASEYSAEQIQKILSAWRAAHGATAQTTQWQTPDQVLSGGSHDARPFEQVGFANEQAREDMAQTAPRLQYGLGYVLGPLSPEVTSVSHGKHVENSAHYTHKAVDVGAFGGVAVGENPQTWDAVMRAIASGVFSKIGTFYALWSNTDAQAFAHSHGVELFHDEGSGNHVHLEVK